jgi:ubiquinol-cytochrome c reductase cytochrome b subunit
MESLVYYWNTLFLPSEVTPDLTFIISVAVMAGKKGAKYKNPRATNPTKLNVTLTSVQQDIVVGTLLGNATMERAHENHNARLIMDQTFPTHAGYLTTLYVHLINLVKTCPRVIIRKPDIRIGNTYSSMVFKTMALPCLTVFHKLFYVNGRKVVPDNIWHLLTPRALAYWIMDDGGKGSYNEMILHTRSFTLQEVKLLQSVLQEKYQLRTRLVEKTPGQWVIVIPVKQVHPLKDIVAPYMSRDMLYKLH